MLKDIKRKPKFFSSFYCRFSSLFSLDSLLSFSPILFFFFPRFFFSFYRRFFSSFFLDSSLSFLLDGFSYATSLEKFFSFFAISKIIGDVINLILLHRELVSNLPLLLPGNLLLYRGVFPGVFGRSTKHFRLGSILPGESFPKITKESSGFLEKGEDRKPKVFSSWLKWTLKTSPLLFF